MAAEAQNANPHTGPLSRVRGFWDELRTELRQVIWPSWEQVWQTGLVVIASVIFYGVYLFLVDYVLRIIMTGTVEALIKRIFG